ncbi:glycoside hydrolase family 13 protein [Allomuricauda sp. SCSIO 65647]|uniref:glycoside hydrolase family 13 protein n=1 Tax=Allomuricauda sp. SCSIO 65647 TaxID=2908843 RepID=UPI001F46367A|nr:glycoside hydrolase family 13 protein [Muricauda sp. SCSIO 65647]UJH66249.1 glycoside hydrolase family 13 protein [Muricauda sp. SCSIO 65647]
MKRLPYIILFLLGSAGVQPAFSQIERIEPPNWWVGFKQDTLQLLVKAEGLSDYVPAIKKEGVRLIRASRADSPNYLFLDLIITKDAQPGTFDIEFVPKKGKKLVFSYELKQREQSAEDFDGFDSSDVIYLITPDRFANGNPKNDIVKTLKETDIDRSHDYKRHGGDIQGIIDHLDYIEDMGFTAIWSCPLLTNDMRQSSYHGYAMTDFYEVDPRFGTLEDYKKLSVEAAKKGIKLVMDQVANHCGSEHWWMKDLPFADWINFQKNYEVGNEAIRTNHKRTVNQDIYASISDRRLMEEGWFVSAMPDLNQNNPFMAKYIIQNSIWWVETAQLSGIRQDTYPYPNKKFMSDWAKAIIDEYPNFNIVGEEWSTNPLLIGYWQQGAKNADGYESNLPTTMDFAMQTTLVQALTQDENWDTGLIRLYEGLANDFYYPDPKSILFFGDNHDMSRIHTQLDLDVDLTKMAMAYVLSVPRIPQVYYGTEILMEDSEKPGDHGLIRSDFPGGWDGDAVNAFTGEGLSPEQKDMQSYLKKILNYRRGASVVHSGKTKHFGPHEGIYALFRYNDEETLLLVLNKNTASVELSLDRFAEMDIEGKTAKNIIAEESMTLGDKLILQPKSALLLSIKN